MYTVSTRELSPSETKDFKNLLTNRLPAASLGRFASQGANYNPIRFDTAEGDTFQVTLIPEEMSQTVQNEAVTVTAFAIIFNREDDVSWYVSSETVEASTILPTLKQAFHEAEQFYDREADFRYHFSNGETAIAVPTSNPVQRLDDELTITAVEYIGGTFPQRFLLETDTGECYYLRERSGTIRLISDGGDGKTVFHAFIGREHPGTQLYKDEVLNIISSVEYITLVEEYATEVSEEAKSEYYTDALEFQE